MRYCFIDTEGTGLPDHGNPSGHPAQPRMIQICMTTTENGKTFHSYMAYVKPDGWEVSPYVVELTGITTEMCEKFGLPIAEIYAKFLAIAKEGYTFVAHGKSHDRKCLKIEAVRLGYEELPDNDWKCTMIQSMPYVRAPKKGGGLKFPRLGEAYKHFSGKELEGAHEAKADCDACQYIFYQMNPVE